MFPVITVTEGGQQIQKVTNLQTRQFLHKYWRVILGTSEFIFTVKHISSKNCK